MVQQMSYTIKQGHKHGQTKNTKEYYSFNTLYIIGFRNKYAIIYSTINNEFYRAMFLLSICCSHGGHLLIVNTVPKYRQYLYSLISLGKETKKIHSPFSPTSQRSMKKICISKQFFSLAKTFNKKFLSVQSLRQFYNSDRKNGVDKFNLDKWYRKNKFLKKNLDKFNDNKISIFSGLRGGTVTNWKQLFSSTIRGYVFEKKFQKYIYENYWNFPPYKKFKKSAVRVIERAKSKLNKLQNHSRPDCILIIGNGGASLLKNAYYLHIPTIVTVDSHVDVNYCTYPIWGNTVSAHFLPAIIEWFFRCSPRNEKNLTNLFK